MEVLIKFLNKKQLSKLFLLFFIFITYNIFQYSIVKNLGEQLLKTEIKDVSYIAENIVKQYRYNASFLTILQKICDYISPNGLYISVINTDGIVIAHPNKNLIGKNILKFKDKKGTYFIQDIIKTALIKVDGDYLEYIYENPITKKEELKIVYVKLIPETNYILFVGIYNTTIKNFVFWYLLANTVGVVVLTLFLLIFLKIWQEDKEDDYYE